MYGFPILYILTLDSLHLKTSHSEWVMSDWPLCVITILSILNICFTNLCMKPKGGDLIQTVKIMEEKMSLINRKFTAVMLFGMFLYSRCKPCINVNPLIPSPSFSHNFLPLQYVLYQRRIQRRRSGRAPPVWKSLRVYFWKCWLHNSHKLDCNQNVMLTIYILFYSLTTKA